MTDNYYTQYIRHENFDKFKCALKTQLKMLTVTNNDNIMI